MRRRSQEKAGGLSKHTLRAGTEAGQEGWRERLCGMPRIQWTRHCTVESLTTLMTKSGFRRNRRAQTQTEQVPEKEKVIQQTQRIYALSRRPAANGTEKLMTAGGEGEFQEAYLFVC